MKWTLRPWRDLRNDPELIFKIGALAGGARLASHLLADSSDETTRRLAAALGAQADWFHTDPPRAADSSLPTDWPLDPQRTQEHKGPQAVG